MANIALGLRLADHERSAIRIMQTDESGVGT